MENQDPRLILLKERFDILSEQINRLQQAFVDYSEGKDIEYLRDEDLFLEEVITIDKCESLLARYMQHLLKLKYCTNNYSYNTWIHEIDNKFQSGVMDITKWVRDKSHTNNVIKAINSDIELIYTEAVGHYKSDSKKYKDLQDGLKYIPEKCPWTLEDLMELTISEIISILPDPDVLHCQMQLYPFCILNENGHISSKTHGLQCTNCEHYAGCIAEYYNKEES